MWWRRIKAWLRCVAVRHAPNVGCSAGGTRSSITSTSRPWCSRRSSQSSWGHRLVSTKRSAWSGTDWAPNSLTNRTRRGITRATSASSPTSPRCQPSHMCESVPSSCGRCGATPPWATVGRVGSACSNDRLTQRSSTDLFHDGSCWATNRRKRRERRSGLRPAAPRRPARRGRTTGRSTGGGRASRPPRAPGGRPPGGSGGRSPTAAGSPAAAACRARRRRGTARGRRCGPARAARRARPRRPARRHGGRRPGAASASPGRVGSRLAPFRNRRSPLIEQTQSFHATSRSPVRRDRRSLTSPSTRTSHVDRRQRLVTERPRPPQARPVDVERPLDLVGAGGERVLGLGDRRAVGGRPHEHRACRVAVERGRGGGGGRGPRRRRGTARAAGRAWRARCRRPAHGARCRPGSSRAIDGLGVLEQPGDVAPTRRCRAPGCTSPRRRARGRRRAATGR